MTWNCTGSGARRRSVTCGSVDTSQLSARACRLRMPPAPGKEKRPQRLRVEVVLDPGPDLFSRGPTSQVSSALVGLTAVFGMGTGVTPPLQGPRSTFYRSLRGPGKPARAPARTAPDRPSARAGRAPAGAGILYRKDSRRCGPISRTDRPTLPTAPDRPVRGRSRPGETERPPDLHPAAVVRTSDEEDKRPRVVPISRVTVPAGCWK